MDQLLDTDVVGDYIKGELGIGTKNNQQTPSVDEAAQDPFQKIEEMAKEGAEVIANAPDAIKDQRTAKINEALPEKIYAYETENSVGERAIGFRNEAGEDVGDLIFFS